MMRSMFAGVSGMRSHQTMMDVIGDNIANVNSSGFKASRVLFQDTLSQLTRDGAAATGAAGAINPSQVGLGVKLNAVDSVVTQGAIQNTGRPTDLAIQGAGYFTVMQNGQTSYTRSGSFSLDSNNRLVDPSGAILQGYNKPANGPWTPDPSQTPVPAPAALSVPATEGGAAAGDKLTSFSIGPDGTVMARYGSKAAVEVGRVALATFANPAGLVKSGDGHLRQGAASGAATYAVPGNAGAATLASGALEMSNVDLSQEFTNMMIAQRGFQANSRVISTTDDLLQELVNLKR